jgi:lysine 2,3-aminomutase
MEDPTGDGAHEKLKGLIHRYPDRVLLKPTLTCLAYCRFCFRREKVGQGEANLTEAELDAAFGYIAAHPEIYEVILSGGDPLALSERRLAAIMARLSAISHVRVIRIHTRVPLVAPERINGALVAALKARQTVYVALHVNHAQELSDAVCQGIARLRAAGLPLLAQSVLLKGVNDKAEVLEALFRALLALGVMPYYLHPPDQARGTGHFRLSIAQGQAIMRQLRGRLSGPAIPTYIFDIPGGYGKVPVGPDYLAGDSEIFDPSGQRHRI